jgi:hypothetical protein
LWVDTAVHGVACGQFDSYVVKGPGPDNRDFFTGAIGKDGYGRAAQSGDAFDPAFDRSHNNP